MSRVIRAARSLISVQVVGVMTGHCYPVPDCPPFSDIDAAQDWCDDANKKSKHRITRWEPIDDARVG